MKEAMLELKKAQAIAHIKAGNCLTIVVPIKTKEWGEEPVTVIDLTASPGELIGTVVVLRAMVEAAEAGLLDSLTYTDGMSPKQISDSYDAALAVARKIMGEDIELRSRRVEDGQ